MDKEKFNELIASTKEAGAMKREIHEQAYRKLMDTLGTLDPSLHNDVTAMNFASVRIMRLQDLLCEAKSMIDGAYDIVEIWDTSGSPYNKQWKKDWLDKAKEKFGATPYDCG